LLAVKVFFFFFLAAMQAIFAPDVAKVQ
jgi:hypothetical protein